MNIAVLVFNPVQENTYILWDQTGECVIVDAGNSSDRENNALENFIAEKGLNPVAAINTHGHFDHALGVQFVKERYEIPFAVSSKDQFLLDSAQTSGSVFGISVGQMPTMDVDLDKHEEFTFGETSLKVIKIPGHTPGHVAFFEPKTRALITGDTLFKESIGRTDLPGGDYSWIMQSILDEIVPLGDDVTIYPGHGPSSSIGHETKYNPFIVEVINEEVNYKG